MKLLIKWEEFSKQIDDFSTDAKAILDKENSIKSEQEFEQVKTELNNLNTRCYNYLKTSFDLERNFIALAFFQAKKVRYNLGMGNQQKDYSQLKKELFEDLVEKYQTLAYYQRILSISDAYTKPDLVNLTNRNDFTTHETLELILDKLYDLYDNGFHPIPLILEGNGISLKRLYEDRELGKTLEDLGYVKLTHTRDASAQLTLHGKIYIEEKRKTYKENYEDISKSQAEINSRVDEIVEQLTKLGLGQEIIFDEINELKELYTTLNKKNWGQVVKGKLVDLALAKLIENDTMKFIYEGLTKHAFRLP